MNRKHQGPRILMLDIETFPNLAYVWGAYEQNVLAFKRHSIVCCFSAKWYGGKQITKALPDYKGYRAAKWDDKKLLADIWKLLDAADIVMAQNGDRFDIRKLNTRFAKHRLGRPAPFRTVDTLKVARKHFAFPSNKLDDLCEYLGIGRKLSTGGFSLWLACMAGDKKAWGRMRRYNAHDTRLLKPLYELFLPWIDNHPNVGLYSRKNVCPKCGSRRLQARGTSRNATTHYRRFQCLGCGGWGRSTERIGSAKIVNA